MHLKSAKSGSYVFCPENALCRVLGVMDIRYLDCGGQFAMDIHMEYETAIQTYTTLLCQLYKLGIKYGQE